MKKSKWFFWSFVPFINFAAWIHAAIRTGRNSYYWFVAIYALPFAAALVMGMVEDSLGLSKQAIEKGNDWGGTVAAVMWIAGMIHALLKKDTVDQQIQAHEIGQAQTVLATADGKTLLATEVPKTQNEKLQSQTPPPPMVQQVIETPNPESKKGTILDYSIQKSEGIISGDDNNRYRFAGSEWKSSGAPKRGQRVSFEVVDGRAVGVS